ncbi:MAG: hypothetical protein WBA12_11945 [Catalinimonas sp.]
MREVLRVKYDLLGRCHLRAVPQRVDWDHYRAAAPLAGGQTYIVHVQTTKGTTATKLWVR